jgi:hypothetical protein
VVWLVRRRHPRRRSAQGPKPQGDLTPGGGTQGLEHLHPLGGGLLARARSGVDLELRLRSVAVRPLGSGTLRVRFPCQVAQRG